LHERLRSIAVGEDRERIARDLHDSVIQDLFAVGLALQGVSQLVSDTTAAATIEDSIDRLDRVVETLRAYIFELRSRSERRQLDERLQELIARLGSAYPAAVVLEIGIHRLDSYQLEDEVVKFVTEALSNALRHSRATEVDVIVDSDDGWCRVTIRDNGVGFDVGSATPGMGLANMTARATALGGHLELNTGPGVGTLVEISLPMT
jgi:signal transduction histidine kinase